FRSVDGTGPSSTARVTVPPSRAFTSPSMVPAPLHSSQYVPGLRVSGVSGRVTVPLTEARTRRSPGPHRRTLIASSLPNQAPYPAPVTRTARATPAATNARRLQRRGLRSDTVEDPPRRTYAQRPELLLGQPDPAAQIELHQALAGRRQGHRDLQRVVRAQQAVPHALLHQGDDLRERR